MTHHSLDRHSFNGLFSRTTWVSWYHNDKTILDFNEARDNGVTVASAGPYANHLHLAPDRKPCQPAPCHSIFLQAGWSSWRPTNSVKALKASTIAWWKYMILGRDLVLHLTADYYQKVLSKTILPAQWLACHQQTINSTIKLQRSNPDLTKLKTLSTHNMITDQKTGHMYY